YLLSVACVEDPPPCCVNNFRGLAGIAPGNVPPYNSDTLDDDSDPFS
ncbi:uncharacterized protein METZ01_LOCUS170133, partial [marine metagenome]